MNIREYWNSKHPKKDIKYGGRALRGCYNRIPIDVRSMIWANDCMLKEVASKVTNGDDTYDVAAHKLQKFIVSNIEYVSDKKSSRLEEFWQFPNETLISGCGDCEDSSILLASLLINAGIPSWRVRVTAGLVSTGRNAPDGGHAYVTYCRESDNNWVVLDWCYLEDSSIPVNKKPLFKDKKNYKKIWFSFNNNYSWAHYNIDVIEGIK